jgi:hypothetical protein
VCSEEGVELARDHFGGVTARGTDDGELTCASSYALISFFLAEARR